MEKQHKHLTKHSNSQHSLPIVEILVAITIVTALSMGIIVSINPIGKILAANEQGSVPVIQPKDIPLPPLESARNLIPGGSPFFTAMNEFPQVIGGYTAPANLVPKDHPFYLEISIRDREAPVSKVIVRIETPLPIEIPLTLIDGTDREGTWGAVWRYPGNYPMSVISSDTKNNSTKLGLTQ